MLWPEGNIHLEATPVNGYLNAACYGVLFANAIEDYVDGALKLNSCFEL